MANVLCLGAFCLWPAATGAEELEGLNGYHLLLGLSVATAAGLIAAEIVLGFARRALRGGFLSRYAAMILGVSLGGALTVLSPAPLAGVTLGIADAEPFGNILLPVAVLAVYGELTGMIGGLILASPLAAFPGRFETAG